MLRRQRLEGKPVPGPGPLALLQGLRSLQKDPLEYVTRLQQKFGDLVRIRLRPQDIFLVTEPTLIEESCRSPSVFTRGTIVRRAREVIGPSLIVSEGPEWKRHRRLMTPGFRSRFLANLRPAVDAAATEMTNQWIRSERGTVDVEEAARHYTLDSTCRAVFGRVLPAETDALGRALTDVLDLTVRRAREVLPLPLWVPTRRHRAFADRRRRANALVDDLLQYARRLPPDRCLAARLAHDAHVSGDMSSEQLRAEAFGLLFSGYESPTRTLTWTLSLLARHPKAQEQARDSIYQQVEGAIPPANDFLIATIKEAMRLYPPGWILGREASRDTVLGGFGIRKGAFLMYSAWVTHRRSDLWEAPLEFRPSRFLERARPEGSNFSYFPFGLPPNHCIGAGFALLQARAAITKILMSFELRATGAPPRRALSLRPRYGHRGLSCFLSAHCRKSDPDAGAQRLGRGGSLKRRRRRTFCIATPGSSLTLVPSLSAVCHTSSHPRSPRPWTIDRRILPIRGTVRAPRRGASELAESLKNSKAKTQTSTRCDESTRFE